MIGVDARSFAISGSKVVAEALNCCHRWSPIFVSLDFRAL